jgi:hypothetical protein
MTNQPDSPQPLPNNRLSYPFELANAFFVCIDLQRSLEVKANAVSEFTIQLKITLDKYPERVQVNIRTQPKEDAPIKFSLELVGIFNYTGNSPDADRSRINEFLNNQGILMLWQYIVFLVRTIAPHIGTEGVHIPMQPDIAINEN